MIYEAQLRAGINTKMAKKQTGVLEPDDNKKKGKKKSEISFFDELLDKVGLDIPVAAKTDDTQHIRFLSTGSLMLNALISGSMNGGIAANKITALAGEEATGKTFIALQCVQNFLDTNPTGEVFIFDSEDDPSKLKGTLVQRGIDPNRVRVRRVNTIQDFRHKAIQIIDKYLEYDEAKRPPMMFVLDSLGNLSTLKELHDTASNALNKKGEDVMDMTRTRLIRGLFRVLTIKLGDAMVPLLITNHTYESPDMYAGKKMSGGGGLKYAASTIIFLGKKKHRDEDKEVIGSILTAVLDKSRFTRYGLQAELLLTHARGLDKYWGLFDFGLESGLLLKGTGEKGNKIRANYYKFPDGQIASKAEIIAHPAKYFDVPENFAAFEEQCAKDFLFGSGEEPEVEEDALGEDDQAFDIDALDPEEEPVPDDDLANAESDDDVEPTPKKRKK